MSMPTPAFDVGETLPVFIDTGRVHFFDPGETGERIAKNHSLNALGLKRSEPTS